MPLHLCQSVNQAALGGAPTMPVLRVFLALQLGMFLFLPPFAIAAATAKLQWILVGIPWALFCVFLFGYTQGRGLLFYSEEKYLPIINLSAKDTVHKTLLATNVAAAAVIAAAALFHGYV